MRKALAAAVVLALAVAFGAGAAPRHDYALVARDILPPGNFGGINFTKNSSDQALLYDALTPLEGNVTAKDVTKDFKAEPLWTGNEKAVRVELPGRGVKILRDTFDVPHVFAKTETSVFYGTGYAAAEDRGVLMELARYPGRLGCIDAPGFNAFAIALSGKQFQPSAQTEAFLAKQISWLTSAGAKGRQELADLDAYVAGINAQRKSANLEIAPWTRNDVVATTCLLGARFGAGGGDEARRSELLAALETKLGSAKGLSVFNDLREQNDPSAPTTLTTPFPYGPQSSGAPGPGNAIVDDASVQLPTESLHAMSNAVLVSAKRSTTGHPIMVAGPQLGYFYPEFFWEVDMEGGGVSARGGSLAGIPNILIGRGPDYGWSFTSSDSDNIDTFSETLCGDDHHYVYKGTCTAMTRFDAGSVVAGGVSTPVVFYETVHGPVIGYGTVNGTRVALSQMRSTRGRELKAALDVYDLSTGRLKSAQQFTHDMSRFEMAFNGFYVDSKHIAYVSCGRLPLRAAAVDPGFPTIGTGAYDWTGFLAPAKHPQAIDPASGELVNWNNKPAPQFSSADDNFSYGPVHRVELLQHNLKPGKSSVLDVVNTMNKAATQDLRVTIVWPQIVKLLALTPAPSPRDASMKGLMDAWLQRGAARIDANGDGKVDDPGAAIIDAAWPKLADAALAPVLGPLTDRLDAVMERDNAPGPGGSSFIDGWYGYLDKDLRSVAGGTAAAPYANRYCGGGDATTCSKALWSAIDAAGVDLAAKQSDPDPVAWRADATKERIQFAPGFLPVTMRWANRPTYQQILVFDGHR
ncbi:MAG TPA: penicillin acylase family protein [Gaiellaceae bacterium]